MMDGMKSDHLYNYLAFWTCSCSILNLPCPSYKGLLMGLPFLRLHGSDRSQLMMMSWDAESLASSMSGTKSLPESRSQAGVVFPPIFFYCGKIQKT